MSLLQTDEKYRSKLKDLIAEFKMEVFIPRKCANCDRKDECSVVRREVESANVFLQLMLWSYAEYLDNILPVESIIYNIEGVVKEWIHRVKKEMRGVRHGDSD